MLITACDDKYLSEAKILIRSCARYEPNQRFYLFLVNSDSVPDLTIKRWHPNIIIERVTWPYDAERWRGIMCSARSIPIQNTIERYHEPVIYLDSDTLLRGPLTGIFQALETCDLMVRFRPDLEHVGAAGTPYGSTFNSGVIAIRPSAAGMHFAQEYNRLLQEFLASGKSLEVYRQEYRIRFVVDQELLYVTYLRLQDEIVFRPLPAKFNDAKFDPSSIIWHGKGSAREHPQYVLEKLRHSGRLLYYPFGILSSLLNVFRLVRYSLLHRQQLIL